MKTSSSNYVGRPHFARYMVQCGFVKDESKAFKRYLGRGKVGDVKHLWPEMAEVINWIRGAGGTAVLAHPTKYKLSRTKLLELCHDFKCAGGQAIEVISGTQSVADTSLRQIDAQPRQCRLLDWAGQNAVPFPSIGIDFLDGCVDLRMARAEPLCIHPFLKTANHQVNSNRRFAFA